MESSDVVLRSVTRREFSLDFHATVDVKPEPEAQSQLTSSNMHANSTRNARFIHTSSENTPIKVSHQHSDSKHKKNQYGVFAKPQ